jgi:hypothetical protein
VAIARGGPLGRLPSRFMLRAGTNPCPCGYACEGELCLYSESESVDSLLVPIATRKGGAHGSGVFAGSVEDWQMRS